MLARSIICCYPKEYYIHLLGISTLIASLILRGNQRERRAKYDKSNNPDLQEIGRALPGGMGAHIICALTLSIVRQSQAFLSDWDWIVQGQMLVILDWLLVRVVDSKPRRCSGVLWLLSRLGNPFAFL